MKHLFRYIKGYRVRAVMAPLFKMLEACFELMVPLVMARMIDIGIANGDKPYIIRCALTLLLLTVVGLTASITAQFFAAKAAMGFGKGLRHDLFRKVQSLSFSDVDNLGASTLITRLTSDVNQSVTGVNMFLRLFLRSPFIVIGAVIMSFTVDARASLIYAVVMPLLIIVVFIITFRSIPMYKNVQGRLDRMTLLTREALSGVRVIRAFSCQDESMKEYEEASDDLRAAQIRVGRISNLMNPVTLVIVNLGLAGLIYMGGVRVNIGGMTQGQVVALVNYISQILVELVKLANLIITMTKATASARRISDILMMEPAQSFIDGEKSDAEDSLAAGNVQVKFDNVSLKYPGSKENAIEGITFTAEKGETIGIIGGTGSGKSTIINAIPRFYDITDGSITIDGRDIGSYSKEELRSKVAFVPQTSTLFSGSVAENLRMGNEDADEASMKKSIEMAQAAQVIERHGGTLEAEILQGGKNLSGGEKQRLSIARALVRDSELLILDDSFSALDYATEAKLRDSLKNERKDGITFIVSQRPSSIMHADTIIVMEDGSVAGIGKHEELLKDCEIYREICRTQLSGMEVTPS